MFLVLVDKRVNAQVVDSEVICEFRYVDDYLIVLADLSATDFENVIGMITRILFPLNHVYSLFPAKVQVTPCNFYIST